MGKPDRRRRGLRELRTQEKESKLPQLWVIKGARGYRWAFYVGARYSTMRGMQEPQEYIK
tara:strand:- start:1219 stop:1398 length:180 start_codon:yes stop_codon:yes gene_type:complete